IRGSSSLVSNTLLAKMYQPRIKESFMRRYEPRKLNLPFEIQTNCLCTGITCSICDTFRLLLTTWP
ncbi:hypothetical protein BDZ94DRAFT_1277966, partial [Collybia nuda]